MTKQRPEIITPRFPYPPSTNKAYRDSLYARNSVFPIHTMQQLLKNVFSRRVKTRECTVYQQTIVSLMNSSGLTSRLRDFVDEHIFIECVIHAYKPNWITKQGLPNRLAGDWDNTIKMAQDAMFTAIGRDDSAIFYGGVRKLYAETPSIALVFWPQIEIADEF